MKEAPSTDAVLQARTQEHDHIMHKAKIEWQWWGNPQDRYGTAEARTRAIEHGLLVPVTWEYGVDNELFGLSTNLHNNEGTSSRYLRPEAYRFFTQLLVELKERTRHISPNIRPIVTSLHRLDDTQRTLTESEQWYRAAPVGQSSHAAGAAFDIQIGKYYVAEQDSKLYGTWLPTHADRYDNRYDQILKELLDTYQDATVINYIMEHTIDDFGHKTPAVFHVCIAPTSVRASTPSQ